MERGIEIQTISGELVTLELMEAEDQKGFLPAGGMPGPQITFHRKKTFDHSLAQLEPLANSVVERFRNAEVPPDQVDVEFGFSLKAEGTIVILRGSSEANFKVKLTWKKS